ncbi:MAG: baseplate J/gp47 family protein [Wolinella sp.]
MNVPNFIKPLDIDKERESILEAFKQKSGKLDYIPLISDDYMSLIDIFLYRLNNFIELVNVRISQNYLNFSTGEYLDELVALIGIKRHEEIKPIAEVKITVSSPTFLPKGSKFTDNLGHFAYLLHDLKITDEAVGKIEADGYFTESYETTTLEIPNIYVKSIELTSPFAGYFARESDEELRERFLLSLHRFSTAGSEKSYLFFVLNTEGINRAKVHQAGAGIVQIIFYSQLEESIAIDKIRDSLKGRIPLTDEVRIKKAQAIPLKLHIKIAPTKDYLFSEILKEASAKIKQYFESLEIGESPHQSKIIELSMNEQTRSAEIISTIPAVQKDQMLILESLKIEHTR